METLSEEDGNTKGVTAVDWCATNLAGVLMRRYPPVTRARSLTKSAPIFPKRERDRAIGDRVATARHY